MEKNYLTHHGVKGMKWGVIRSKIKKGSAQEPHDDYKRAHDKKSVKYMSDAELKSRNTRLQAERQYNQMTKKTGNGKKAVDRFIATAGTVTAAVAAYGTYKKLGNDAIDKIGNWIVNSINLSGPLH